MNNGKSLDTNAFIEILGGTDVILQHYLSSNNLSPLTSKQLPEINHLLNLQQEITTPAPIENIPSPILTVSSENTLLHQLFGKQIGDKILKIMYSRFMMIIIFLTLTGWFIIWLLLQGQMITDDPTYFAFTTIIYALSFIFVSSLILAMNKTIMEGIFH